MPAVRAARTSPTARVYAAAMGGVRVGTRVGRRGWVSAPLWLVVLALPFIALFWAMVAVLWLAWIVLAYTLAVFTLAIRGVWHRAAG